MFGKNWKTSGAGLAAVLTSAGHLLTAVFNGDFSTVMTDVPAIIAGPA